MPALRAACRTLDREAEVVQGLDSDHIDLTPGNGTENLCQP